MKEIMVQFKKAEVANYNLDNQSFDVRIVYDVDGKQRQTILHVTKEDRDILELAENIVLSTRRAEKNNCSLLIDATNPLTGFVNIKIVNEDDLPEGIARFITKVMNQGRTNANSQSIPRYQIRDAMCKMSMNL